MADQTPDQRQLRVSVPPDLAVPAREVVATARGNGTYRASGLLTPMVGQWRVQVRLGDGAPQQTATFALPVKAQPVAPPPNQAPAIDANTLALGLAEILAVVVSLLFASWLSAAIGSPRWRGLVAAFCANWRR